MLNVAKIAVIGAGFLLAGCSSLNPFASKSADEKPTELTSFQPAASLKNAWKTSIGKTPNAQFVPALSGDSVVAASTDGKIASIDLQSGAVKWRIDAGLALTAGVGADETTIAVGAQKGVLLAFDRSGKSKWKAQAPSEILSTPAVGEGLVVVRSIDNNITAFDAASGERRWSVRRNAPALILRAAPGILIQNQTVYVALPGGRLSALSAENGAPRWEIAVGEPRGTTELERIADVSGHPVIAGDDICAVSFQGRIGCFDALAGTPRWLKSFSSEVGLGADQQSVVGINERGHLVGFSKGNGEEKWRNEKLANRNLSAPGLLGSYIAVGDYQGYLHLLTSADGSFAARIPTDGSRIVGKPVISGNTLVVQTQSGSLAAFLLEK